MQVKVYVTLDIPTEQKDDEIVPSWTEIARDINWGINYMTDTLGWDVTDFEIK